MKKIILFLLLGCLFAPIDSKSSNEKVKFYEFQPFYIKVQQKKNNTAPKQQNKVKFYNFDDLLIDGKVRKPQILYTDARQKVRFERLLKLRRDFLPKLKNTRKDPSLR